MTPHITTLTAYPSGDDLSYYLNYVKEWEELWDYDELVCMAHQIMAEEWGWA